MPAALRRGDGTPKYLLRAVLARYLPAAMIDRPKRGFSIPVGSWLAGPWRPWAESLLEHNSLAPYFDAQRVQTLWRQHLAGTQDNATALWNILMVQAWARRWS